MRLRRDILRLRSGQALQKLMVDGFAAEDSRLYTERPRSTTTATVFLFPD
jgi:hypothetical protein